MDEFRSGDTATGWMFVGVYACVVIAAFALFAARGDMGGLVVVFFALPWSALGNALAGPSGLLPATYCGLVLNGVAVFLIGRHLCPRIVDRMRLRMEETERFRQRQEEADR